MQTSNEIGLVRKKPAVYSGFLLIFLMLFAFGKTMAQDEVKPPVVQSFYLTANAELLFNVPAEQGFHFQNSAFGLKLGTMRKVGWYVSLMSNFHFKGMKSTYTGNYNPKLKSKSYVEGMLGMSFRHWKTVTWQLGAGFFYRTFNYGTYYHPDNLFHFQDEEEKGPVFATGFMFDLNKRSNVGALLTTELVGAYDINSHKGKDYKFGDRFSFGLKLGIGLYTPTRRGRQQWDDHYNAHHNPMAEHGGNVQSQNVQGGETKTGTDVESTLSDSTVSKKETKDESENPVVDSTNVVKIEKATVETGAVINITENSAQVQGTLLDDGGGKPGECGFCFDTNASPALDNASHVVASNAGQKSFNMTIDRLRPSTTYYVRAYAVNEAGVSYGQQTWFTTDAEIPAVETLKPTEVAATSAICGGVIRAEKYDGKTIEAKGICYDTTKLPTISSKHTLDGDGFGEFTSTLTNLQPNTVYYVRAYVSHANGVDYGDPAQSFRTRPALYTTAAYNISDTSVMTGGYDLYDRGGVKVREKGVCCSYRPNPTVENYRVVTASWDVQNDSWKSVLVGLEPNTDFHIRAYVILDNEEILYGNDQAFRTKPACGQFTVSDVDGNEYHTVKIGKQCWLKENMRTTRYSDGSLVNPDSMMSPGWDSVNVPIYGYLYNWSATVRDIAMTRESSDRVQGICPSGWHIPSKTDWQTLFDYVKSRPEWVNGKSKNSIAKALSAQEKWDEGLGFYPSCFVCKNLSANNGTGFSALPAGYYGGDYESMTVSTYFWSSTCGQYGKELGPYSVSWGNDKSTVDMRPWVTGVGCSVRCVKD